MIKFTISCLGCFYLKWIPIFKIVLDILIVVARESE